jgi:peptidase M23B
MILKLDALNRQTRPLLVASLAVLMAGCAATRPAPVVHRTPMPEKSRTTTVQTLPGDVSKHPGGPGPLGQSGYGQPSADGQAGRGQGEAVDTAQVTPIYQGAINTPGRWGLPDDVGVKVGPQGIKRAYGTPRPPLPRAEQVARAVQTGAVGMGAAAQAGGGNPAAVAGRAAQGAPGAPQAGQAGARDQGGRAGAAAGAAGAVASPVTAPGEIGKGRSAPAGAQAAADKAGAAAAESQPAAGKAPAVPSATRNFDGVRFSWPLAGSVLQGFDGVNNKGLLLSGKTGEAVQAAADGKVIFSGEGPRGYGNLIIIKHSNEMLSVYAHNRSLAVKEGQQVTRGQKIGELGTAGGNQSALHFEVRQAGKPVDPAGVLPKR